MSEPDEVVDLYGASYGGFASDTYAEVRREAYGEELGQSSWLTREELDRFATELALGPSSRLLEIGSGSGGPALHLVRSTGCEVVGIDVNEDGVANATRLAREAELDARASFVRADASQPLPFESESFAARAKRADALREIEGDETFDGQQRFLEVAATLAGERRLSRFVYLAEKPT